LRHNREATEGSAVPRAAGTAPCMYYPSLQGSRRTGNVHLESGIAGIAALGWTLNTSNFDHNKCVEKLIGLLPCHHVSRGARHVRWLRLDDYYHSNQMTLVGTCSIADHCLGLLVTTVVASLCRAVTQGLCLMGKGARAARGVGISVTEVL